MKVLITGVCGFVGSALVEALLERREGISISGIDNLQRPGSEINRGRLRSLGVQVIHGDIRAASDFENLPCADWVIDAAANPSVLAGVRGNGSSRQLFEHNLASLVNILEYCAKFKAGLLLLSTSRVYSISLLASLPLKSCEHAFRLDTSAPLPQGITESGINTEFSTAPPISLYGGTKLACEIMALEYGFAYDFPVWINRCGVLTGAGQFGTPDQGIFSFWINAHLRRRALKYIGFDGLGKQVRDFFHPRDLGSLVDAQINASRMDGHRIYTAGGGPACAMSLAQLNLWCDNRFGAHQPESDTRKRPYDIPWMIMDNTLAEDDFGWHPSLSLDHVLEDIATHAEQHPDWLERSGV